MSEFFLYSTSAPPQQGGALYSLPLPTVTFSHLLLLLYVGLCIFSSSVLYETFSNEVANKNTTYHLEFI